MSLTVEQKEFFLENGYIIIRQAFSKEQNAAFTKEMWIRLGMDPKDKSTWKGADWINMPVTRRVRVDEFAPNAWSAITELLGGEDRVNVDGSQWADNFIVNLGSPELEGAQPHEPRDLDFWHVDGDFFVHYLDSPEQALLVVPLFSDIYPGGGATWIAPEGIDMIARYLASHPEGVIPEDLTFRPSYCHGTYTDWKDHPGFWSHLEEIKKCTKFVELTGEVGDVVLMHPLMMHSKSKNILRVARVISNPPASLREPFNFDRDDPTQYSLVERKTLKALGVERFAFAPTTERKQIVPKRVLIQQRMLEEERKRLEDMRDKATGTGATPTVMA